MTDTQQISLSLREARQALTEGDRDAALSSLVDVREQGVTTKALENAISSLRKGEEERVADWIDAVTQRLENDEANPFRDLDIAGFRRVPSDVSLSAIEKDLLGDLDGALGEESDPISIDFALVSNSEAESEGLSPGGVNSSFAELDDDGDENGRAPLTDEEKTKLRSSLADRLKTKSSAFGASLTTKSSQAVGSDGTDDSEPSEAGEPREVVSNQGAVDDFFADLADDDAGPDEELFEIDEDVPEVDGLIPDEFEDPFEDLDEESNVRELTPMGSIDAVSRDASAARNDESADEERESKGDDPANPFADLMYLEDDEPAEEEPEGRQRYDSGVSQVRYRGVEPPPPTHRLKGGGDLGVEESEDFSLEPPSDDDVDFDLGFTNPEARVESPFGDVKVQKPESEADDFDFDLGLNQPRAEYGGDEQTASADGDDPKETKPGDDNPKETKPGIESKNDARETRPKGERNAGREPQPTPLNLGQDQSEPIDEDEFFALAESFASESSAAEQQPYRGEPVVKDRPSRTPTPTPTPTPVPEPESEPEVDDNPFAHEAPTGVRHAAVESSFVLEEVDEKAPKDSASSSHVMTNMSAILLEARRMYEAGDFEEALGLCQKIISRGDSPEAQELLKTIEGEMERVTIDEIGSLSRIPALSIDMSELSSMDLDHRAGFLISQIDGMMSFEDIIELSSMSRLETMEVLAQLLREGVISVE